MSASTPSVWSVWMEIETLECVRVRVVLRLWSRSITLTPQALWQQDRKWLLVHRRAAATVVANIVLASTVIRHCSSAETLLLPQLRVKLLTETRAPPRHQGATAVFSAC